MSQQHYNLNIYFILIYFLFILMNLINCFNINENQLNNSYLNKNNSKQQENKFFNFNKLNIDLIQNKKRRSIKENTNFGVRHYYIRRNNNLNYFNKKKQKFKKLNSKILITAKNTIKCPNKLDAVTKGYNKRLYIFSGEIVYEVWRDLQGLQQRQAYLIRELFPNGPRQVTAALNNYKSGITLLISWKRVYRYKWNRKNKQFYMARNSPKELPYKINFVPRVGFQWNRGHLILANKDNFAVYDPYWNLASFVSTKVLDYFPNLLMERLIGVIKYDSESMLWMTKEGRILLYDFQKNKISLEIPIDLSRFIACLILPNSTIGNFG